MAIAARGGWVSSMQAEPGTAATQRQKVRHTRVELYLRSVSRQWKRAVTGADRVLVLSPYLTSKTAEAILATTPGERCAVYTVFEAMNFAAGASSIRTLKRLREHGCKLYHLPDLHAKIVLVPSVFASIGSQNLTRRGTLNREATSVYTTPETVAAIWELVQPWLPDARAISDEMLDDMNLVLPKITRAIRKAQRACKALDDRVWEDERQRVAERERVAAEKAHQEAVRRAEEAARAERIRQVMARKAKVDEVVAASAASREVARELIAASAYWLTHPSGPVAAPGHGDRVYGSGGRWWIDFGANMLNISKAIDAFPAIVNRWLDRKLAGEAPPRWELLSRMEDAVAAAVRSSSGGYYRGYPYMEDGYMHFGANGIDVWLFVMRF